MNENDLYQIYLDVYERSLNSYNLLDYDLKTMFLCLKIWKKWL